MYFWSQVSLEWYHSNYLCVCVCILTNFLLSIIKSSYCLNCFLTLTFRCPILQDGEHSWSFRNSSKKYRFGLVGKTYSKISWKWRSKSKQCITSWIMRTLNGTFSKESSKSGYLNLHFSNVFYVISDGFPKFLIVRMKNSTCLILSPFALPDSFFSGENPGNG